MIKKKPSEEISESFIQEEEEDERSKNVDLVVELRRMKLMALKVKNNNINKIENLS